MNHNCTHTTSSSTNYDVVVIGGGAAGMMAAATAAARGLQVVLLEKNPTLGKKLAITGGGRCNVTNNKPVVREMLACYQSEGKFLFSTFTQYGVAETIDWFAKRGVSFKEENEGRLFPVTESAETIRHALETEVLRTGVTLRCNEAVRSIEYDQATSGFTVTTDVGETRARACIVATGGLARPETGSTGDGFDWLTTLGHTVVPNSNALVPITLASRWTAALSGLILPEVKVTVVADQEKQFSRSGRLLFTHVGLSGPLILNMSKEIGDLLEHSQVTLYLNVFPQYDAGELKLYLAELLASNKKLQNALAEALPRQLVKAILSECDLDGEQPCHSVLRENRTTLLNYLQRIPLPVRGLLGTDKAVISAGGVALEEIDFKTMESKRVSGLYIVGDLLDINRPSGGYSLQLCWSTGYVAGMHVCA